MSIQEMIATVMLIRTRNQSITSRQLLDPLVMHRHRQVIHDSAQLSRFGIRDLGPASHYIPSHCYYDDQELHTFVGVCGSSLTTAKMDSCYCQLLLAGLGLFLEVLRSSFLFNSTRVLGWRVISEEAWYIFKLILLYCQGCPTQDETMNLHDVSRTYVRSFLSLQNSVNKRIVFGMSKKKIMQIWQYSIIN